MRGKKVCTRCGVKLNRIYFTASATALWKKFCLPCAHIRVCHLCHAEFATEEEWIGHINKSHFCMERKGKDND